MGTAYQAVSSGDTPVTRRQGLYPRAPESRAAVHSAADATAADRVNERLSRARMAQLVAADGQRLVGAPRGMSVAELAT